MKVPSSSQSRQSAAPAPGRASITAIMVEFDAASGGRPVGQCAQTNAVSRNIYRRLFKLSITLRAHNTSHIHRRIAI